MPTKYHTQRAGRVEEMLDNTDLNVICNIYIYIYIYKFVTVFLQETLMGMGWGIQNPLLLVESKSTHTLKCSPFFV